MHRRQPPRRGPGSGRRRAVGTNRGRICSATGSGCRITLFPASVTHATARWWCTCLKRRFPGPGPIPRAGSVGSRTPGISYERPHRARRGREILRRGDRGRSRRPRGARRQLLLPARPVRMRQDVDPADDRRPRGDQRRADLHRRTRRRKVDAGRAPDRHDRRPSRHEIAFGKLDSGPHGRLQGALCPRNSPAGKQQRVALARALVVTNPSVLLLATSRSRAPGPPLPSRAHCAASSGGCKRDLGINVRHT